jgi:hypothetical protein
LRLERTREPRRSVFGGRTKKIWHDSMPKKHWSSSIHTPCQRLHGPIQTSIAVRFVASKEPESELVCGTLGEIGQRRMSVEVDPVWRIFAAASIAAISRTLPRGAQSPGRRQPDLVSFAAGSKKQQRSRAVSRTTGRSAEVLREGSGIKST